MSLLIVWISVLNIPYCVGHILYPGHALARLWQECKFAFRPATVSVRLCGRLKSEVIVNKTPT